MKRVLIVDDSPTVRTQIARLLGEAGFETTEAADGVDGIEKLQTHADVRLAILDVNMPRMSGLDMLERVKQDGRYAEVAIIMLTSEGQKSTIERAKRAGAKGWIVKPFNPTMLLAAVQKLTSD